MRKIHPGKKKNRSYDITTAAIYLPQFFGGKKVINAD
jgi:hypothetical protein